MRASSPGRKSEKHRPVGVAPADGVSGVPALVEEFCVLVQGNSTKAGVVILDLGHSLRWSESPAQELEEQPLLEHRVVAKLVVRGILIRLIVDKVVAPDVDWEAPADPGEEIIIGDKFVWHVVVHVVLVGVLIVHVLMIARDCLMMSAAACAKGSH